MRFSIFLILAVIFISCNSSGSDPDEFSYPFTNQTWTVESGEYARWDGVGRKGKALSVASSSAGVDTIFIDNPVKYGLEIKEHDAIEGAFVLSFIDSTVNNVSADLLGLGATRSDSLFDSDLDGGNQRYFSNHVIMNYRYRFDCLEDYQPTDTLHVYWLNSEGTDTSRTYVVPVHGALETVNHVMCEN